MDLSRAVRLIKSLERDPEHVQSYFSDLEAAIRWLMDATFEATNPKEKARLAATEMWARLVLGQQQRREAY